MKAFIVLVTFLAGLAVTAPSARADAFAQNLRLGRGVNIIGYDPIWRARDQARFQAEHFRLLKEAGFQSVRVNLHPFRHMDREKDGALREALAVARATNPTRTVIVGPAFWNSIDHLAKLELPADDRHLIVTVHYYKPMEFTHQGAAWSTHQDKSGIAWRGTAAERKAISDDFAKVATWAKANHRPIFLGEFGAYDRAAMDSRARYTDAVARTAESLGWSWAYWQFDSDFILYDIPAKRWVEPIREALIPPAARVPAPSPKNP